MSNGRKMGFLWGVNFGSSLALAFEVHWSFAVWTIASVVAVYYFRDNDYLALSSTKLKTGD